IRDRNVTGVQTCALPISHETAVTIDEEVRAIIDRCYDTAERILHENRDKLEAMAQALMLYETIDADQIDDIMNGRTPRPPKDWDEPGDDGGVKASAEPAATAEADTAEQADGADDDAIGGPANTH